MENEQFSGLSDLIDVLKNLDNPPEQNGAVGGVVTVGTPTNQLDSSPMHRQQIPPQHLQLQLNNLGDHARAAGNSKSTTGAVSKKLKPYIRIVEQPASKTQRFRYICEGRLAGSIQGVSSTPENRTFPTIEIVGWKGEVKILASLVTKDAPHKAHPHNLTGRDDTFRDGIFKITLKDEPYRVVFNNLGIQCVKKKDIKEALEIRERLEVDPFKQKFTHKDQPSSIDLNAVRLCFQAYIVLPEGGHRQLTPVVSDVIYDKKAINELVICRICCCSAKVSGGDELILLCEKVGREDIKVRFFELNDNDETIWEGFGEFTPNDIHRQTAIAFKTPRYYKDDVDKNAKIFIQLQRPSDDMTSEPLPFEYYPNPDKLLRKRKTETPFLLVKRELQRQERKLSSPSPNFPNAFPDVSPNYANYWNNMNAIKAEPTLSPNPNQTTMQQARLSPNDRITTTPELPYRWIPSPVTQLGNFNTLSIREHNDATLMQIQQQQQQIQQQQQQLQFQQQFLKVTRNEINPFIMSPNDNNNNNNMATTYTTLSPVNINSPTNPFMNPLRNAPYTSGGSITPLLPTYSEQNNNTQQPIQLNINGITAVPQQSPQLNNIIAGALQQQPVPLIIQQEQYTSPIQQSVQQNIIADMQQQLQQSVPVQPTAHHQAQYQEQIDIDYSDEPLTTSGLIRMIVGAEDFPMDMNVST